MRADLEKLNFTAVSANNEQAYKNGLVKTAPKTLTNRFGTYKWAVAVLSDRNVVDTVAPTPVGVGTGLQNLNFSAVLSAVPATVLKCANITGAGRSKPTSGFVYNIGVEGNHNYFIGKRGLLVGNSYDYGRFTGPIKKGYGKGMVTREDLGEVQVHKAEPDKINFTVAHHKQPENYSLVKVGERNWLLLNTTPQKSDALEDFEKLHYIKVDPDKAEQFLNWNFAAGPKIDGAQVVGDLLGDKMKVLSYRKQKGTDLPIEHTQRLGLGEIKVPKELKGTVFKGEAYLTRQGKAVDPQEVSGFLNSSLARASKQKDVEPRVAIFDILKYQGKPAPPEYRKRLELMQQLIPLIGNPRVHMMQTETDPVKARALLDQVSSGRHPLTREGVVFTPLRGGVPRKLKFQEEADVHIRNIVPADTKEGARAGAFDYSLEPEGPIVGRVGSGFKRDLARDMLLRPDEYVGRVARIKAQGQFPGGAYRAPNLISMHEDYPLVKEAYDLDLEEGDTILTGRFRNVPVKVKTIGKDELGQPTVNGRKMLAFRIQKLMPKKTGN
jgi:hypothetical protein